MGLRAVKNQVLEILAGAGPLPEVRFSGPAAELFAGREAGIDARLSPLAAELVTLPRAQVLKVLFSLLCHNDPALRWRAVSLMGPLVAELAEHDLEAARVVVRRMMWSLNDESGGIGWGAPEAMAECLVHQAELAGEYTHILVAFMREDGFYLEYPPLQGGLMWGLGRLAEVRPALLRKNKASCYLLPYLTSPDPQVQGLAARAVGLLQAAAAVVPLRELRSHAQPVTFYHREQLLTATVGELAAAALHNIQTCPEP